MKIKLLFLCLILTVLADAQSYIFGKVTSEEGFQLSGVSVINLRTDERSETTAEGQFMIRADRGDELRFSRKAYTRSSLTVNETHYENPVTLVLHSIPTEIEAVNIRYQATGNLKEDVKHFGDRGKVKALKDDLSSYIARKSSPEAMAPRHGEFVQPVGPGIPVGKVKDRWDDVDLMHYLAESLGREFFTEELKLSPTEIQPFIYFVFTNFDRKQALKYGAADRSVVARFADAAQKQLEPYRNRTAVQHRTP